MIIRLSQSERRKVDEFLKNGSKIEAIKCVRAAAAHQKPRGDGTFFTEVGLAEAKDAIEHYMAERGMKGADGQPIVYGDRARLAPFQPIKRIIVDMGHGDIEVDLEGMSLQILSQNSKIPLEDVSALIDLYNRVKAWTDEYE